MKDPASQCLIIRPPMAVEDALRAVAQVLQRFNRDVGTAFMRASRVDRDGAVDFTWVDAASNNGIRVVWSDDSQIPAQYVEATAREAIRLPVIVERLRHDLPIATDEELFHEVDTRLGVDPGAITRLALAMRGSFDDAVANRVTAALLHPDPAVRRQAQMAAYLLEWEQLYPSIQEAARRETVAELRPGLEFLLQRPRHQ